MILNASHLSGLQVPDQYDVYDAPYGEANFLMPAKRTDGRAPCAPLGPSTQLQEQEDGALLADASSPRCVLTFVYSPRTRAQRAVGNSSTRDRRPTLPAVRRCSCK